MNPSFWLAVLATTISGVLTLVIKNLLKKIKELRQDKKEESDKRETAMQEGLTSLLRVQLIEYHEKYRERGSIPNYAFENWEKMYKAYRGLGGNGMLIQMDEDIRELEFRK